MPETHNERIHPPHMAWRYTLVEWPKIGWASFCAVPTFRFELLYDYVCGQISVHNFDLHQFYYEKYF